MYELDRDLYGGFKANFPDKNNHSIDAVRYALSNHSGFIKPKKEKRHHDFDLFNKSRTKLFGLLKNLGGN